MIHLIRFEDLSTNSTLVITELFKFLDLEALTPTLNIKVIGKRWQHEISSELLNLVEENCSGLINGLGFD